MKFNVRFDEFDFPEKKINVHEGDSTEWLMFSEYHYTLWIY